MPSPDAPGRTAMQEAAQLGLFDWTEPAPTPVCAAPGKTAVAPPNRPRTPPRASAPDAPPVQHYDDGVHRFDWTLHRAARRTLALRVDDRGVSLLAPRLASGASIAQFLQQHAAWAQRKLHQREQRLQTLQDARIDWADGGRIPYLGQHLTLRLRGATQLHWDEARAELHLPLPPDSDAQQVRDSVAAWLQRQALGLFTARVGHFATQLGVRVTAVKLSAATTRWGSAKSDGSIRLHWRLLHFSPQLVDYVVAHEVAHLREMNHSPRFWAHVGQLYPEYRKARQHLRQSTLPPWD
ncbi:MAG: SprT family zinc-dependent metalloprotease [Thiomonas sp.]|nr:SprT family zinc-dependent metalloprotease [Thiomonas sp.]